MIEEYIKDIIKKGEGVQVEFKSCQNEVSSSVYETICSFLNHSGGDILMGVRDTGEIIGVNNNSVNDLVKNIINITNNSELFSPRVSLHPEIIDVDSNKVIYIRVHSAPNVYQYKGKFYDRNGDADNDVTQDPGLLSNLFVRKSFYSSENRIVPMLEIEDLDDKTFSMCRKLVASIKPNHAWLTLTNEEILRSVKLIRKDSSGKEGISLAGLLLFGTEDSIATFYSSYRIEALYINKTYEYHIKNDLKDKVRYDDRITVRDNLIQSYYILTNFIERHLPDKFYLEVGNPQRQDLRSIIFREIIANFCVHREYSNYSPGMFEIFSDRVVVTNWSKPAMGEKGGKVSIDELHTYPKNPLLVHVFRELGLVEELGSGFRNIKKYAPEYYEECEIEIQNNERFVFSMTYQNVSESVNMNDTDTILSTLDAMEVKKGEFNVSESVNKVNECEDKTEVVDESTYRSIIKILIVDNIPGIDSKITILNRMIDEIMAIVQADKLTKRDLKEHLALTDEQLRIDLRELTRSRLLDQKGKAKYYVLSEKSQAKIMIIKKR